MTINKDEFITEYVGQFIDPDTHHFSTDPEKVEKLLDILHDAAECECINFEDVSVFNSTKEEYVQNYVALYMWYLREDIVTALTQLDHVPDSAELAEILREVAEKNFEGEVNAAKTN